MIGDMVGVFCPLSCDAGRFATDLVEDALVLGQGCFLDVGNDA